MNIIKQMQVDAPAKRPYAKPEIVYQQPLEAMAGVCSVGQPGAKVSAASGCGTTFS